MNDERILKTLRYQAWERAKGELRSILQTYWNETEKFNKVDKAIEEFIAKIENEGTVE